MSEGAIIAAYAAVAGSFLMALSSLAVAIINKLGSARKTDVDALTATIKTLQEENTRLHECQDNLNERIDELESTNGQLRTWAEMLVKQIYHLGGTPVPMPKKPKKPRKQVSAQ